MFSVLPIVLSDLTVAEKDISLVASMGALSFVISCLLLARIIHIRGPLSFLKIGIAITVFCESLSFIVLVMTKQGTISPYEALYILIANRIVLNFAWGGYFSAGLIYAGGIVAPANQARAIAAMGLSFAFGGMAGPLMASVVQKFGDAAPYLVSLSFSSIAFMLLLNCRDIERLDVNANLTPMATFTRSALLHAAPHCIAAFGVIIALAMVQQTTAYFFRPYDNEAFTVSVSSLAFLSVGLIVGQLIVIALGGKWSPLMYILVGALLAGISAVAIVFASEGILRSLAVTVSLLVIFGTGIGVVLPNLGVVVLQHCSEQEKPFASSTLNAAQGAGNIIGPLLGGLAFQQGRLLPFSIVIVIMISVILYSRYYDKILLDN